MPLFSGSKQHSATYAFARFFLPDSAQRVEAIRLERLRIRRVSSDGPAAAAIGSPAPSPTAGDGDGNIATPAAARPTDSSEPSVPRGPPDEGPKAQQEAEPSSTVRDGDTTSPAAARPADSPDPSVPGDLPDEGLKAQQEPGGTANDGGADDSKPDKETEAGEG